MAIGFGAAGARIQSVTTSNTPSLPTGTTQNDFLVAHVAHGATTAISTPAGWNAGIDLTFSGYRMYFFWKFAGASESSPTFGVSDLGNFGVISRYTGVPVRADPFNVNPAAATATFSTPNMQGAAIVPTLTATMCVWLWTTNDNSTTGAAGGGATAAYSGAAYDWASTGADASMFSAYKSQATATTTNTITIAASSGSATGCIRFALDPTPVAATNTRLFQPF